MPPRQSSIVQLVKKVSSSRKSHRDCTAGRGLAARIVTHPPPWAQTFLADELLGEKKMDGEYRQAIKRVICFGSVGLSHLSTDLVAALAGLNVDDLPHVGGRDEDTYTASNGP